MNLQVVAHIETGFTQKFGIPRQSGLVANARGRIVFEKEFRNPNIIRGIDEFDYIWLIFAFSANAEGQWTDTVRPPRLGGEERIGVFATRAPYRPNNIGLSSVKLESVEYDTPDGPVINVSGVDLLDGTPIYDIKPYIEYADSHVGAAGGFTAKRWNCLEVEFPDELKAKIPEELALTVTEVLAQDPRPAYDRDKSREFKMAYGGYDISFCATEDKKIRVTGIVKD